MESHPNLNMAFPAEKEVRYVLEKASSVIFSGNDGLGNLITSRTP